MKEFTARTDSNTSDCLPGKAGSRSSRRRAPLNPKVGPDRCICVRYRFARYARQRLELCYSTVLNEAESSVIIWVQVLGSYFPARHEPCPQSPRARKEQTCSSYISKQITQVPTSTCLIGKPVTDTKCPDLDLASGVVGPDLDLNKAVWDQILRGLEFPCDGGQTDRQICNHQDKDTVLQIENSDV